jgi:hypothetical protein
VKKYQYGKSVKFQKTILETAHKFQRQMADKFGILIDSELGDLFETTALESGIVEPTIFELTTLESKTQTSAEYRSTKRIEPISTTTPSYLATKNHSISSKVYDQFYLGFNWPSGFLASAVLIIGIFVGFFINYYCYPRVVYNIEYI